MIIQNFVKAYALFALTTITVGCSSSSHQRTGGSHVRAVDSEQSSDSFAAPASLAFSEKTCQNQVSDDHVRIEGATFYAEEVVYTRSDRNHIESLLEQQCFDGTIVHRMGQDQTSRLTGYRDVQFYFEREVFDPVMEYGDEEGSTGLRVWCIPCGIPHGGEVVPPHSDDQGSGDSSGSDAAGSSSQTDSSGASSEGADSSSYPGH